MGAGPAAPHSAGGTRILRPYVGNPTYTAALHGGIANALRSLS
jgi:hypothetical protein